MHTEVQNYYGEVLQSTDDLKTSACCTADAPPEHLRAALARVHDEVITRYYGCGLVLPEALEGASVLDLGCGAGRDVYTLAQLVGADGFVVGVDMTPEQLDVARRHETWHVEEFGYPTSNVKFIDGNIERLEKTGLADEQFDVIVSNCVINLATDKQAVLNEAWRLLKPGGELYFADIYTDRRVPIELTTDPVLYGECLSGALYWNDFLDHAGCAGFTDSRLVTDKPVSVDDPELAQKVGDIRFFSATYRLFKLPELESGREDYGQSATYRGTAPHHPEALPFDKQLTFEAGVSTPVCGNTWQMLAGSRLAEFFALSAEPLMHSGSFGDSTKGLLFDSEVVSGQTGCC
ncbi:MAG: methyltransferase type 11 [Chromatiales bacterium]|nr:methyltransferase type 11 [Chromatiales bacterium]